MGVTVARLRICKTEPEHRKELIMSVMTGEMAVHTEFRWDGVQGAGGGFYPRMDGMQLHWRKQWVGVVKRVEWERDLMFLKVIVRLSFEMGMQSSMYIRICLEI